MKLFVSARLFLAVVLFTSCVSVYGDMNASVPPRPAGLDPVAKAMLEETRYRLATLRWLIAVEGDYQSHEDVSTFWSNLNRLSAADQERWLNDMVVVATMENRRNPARSIGGHLELIVASGIEFYKVDQKEGDQGQLNPSSQIMEQLVRWRRTEANL